MALTSCIGERLPEPAPAADGLLPVRVRRLSLGEYERSAGELVGHAVAARGLLPPDLRVNGYSVNAEQSVQAGHVLAFERIASAATSSEVGRADEIPLTRGLLGCVTSPSAREQHACRTLELSRLPLRAFRRMPTPEELEALSDIYDLGAALEEDAAQAALGGAHSVLQALLQAPSLLYVTELGDGATGGEEVVRLDGFEVASLLSFTLRGAPPDLPLLERAHRGELFYPEVRESEARRLLSMSDARFRFRQFVREWLEIDGLETLAKNEPYAGTWPTLRSAMLDETDRFVDAVLMHHGAALDQLIAGGFSVLGSDLAAFYGLDAGGSNAEVDTSAAGRIGVLQHASFLAAHAHPTDTSPVRRGDFVLRRLLCTELPRPSELNIEVVPPAPDAALTTRERFAAHVSDPLCSSCHGQLDAIGFTFENFDAIGGRREQENEKPVDTNTVLEALGDAVQLRDSTDLARWIASLPEARECFLRQAFQFFFGAGTDAAVEQAAADAFAALASELPDSRRDNLIEALVAYISSPAFVWRRHIAGETR